MNTIFAGDTRGRTRVHFRRQGGAIMSARKPKPIFDPAPIIERVNEENPRAPLRRCSDCARDMHMCVFKSLLCPLFGYNRATGAGIRCPQFVELPRE